MKLLLHICCAPCLIYPLEKLRVLNFSVSGLFYNPNIHPYLEYKNREDALKYISEINTIKITYAEYLPEEFFRKVSFKEKKPERCIACWQMRIRKTARIAREKGFDYFSTTLLVSPYQDINLLKKIGEELAREEKINFYYEDFRPGFKEAHRKARELNIYCQKYCGCIYSEIERYKKKK
jgi:hypothetical protein